MPIVNGKAGDILDLIQARVAAEFDRIQGLLIVAGCQGDIVER